MKNTVEQKQEEKISYEFGCLLNSLGVKSWDFSNAENCEKIKDIEKRIKDLVKALPKL